MNKFDRMSVSMTLLKAIRSIEDAVRTIGKVQDELSKDFTADGAVLNYDDMMFVSMIAHATINLEFTADCLKRTFTGYFANDQTGQSEEES